MSVYDDINNIVAKSAKLNEYDYSKATGKFSSLYPFTTENLNGYLKDVDLKDKSILTVGSSADQIINSIFYGAKAITCFDINPYVKYYFDLKKAAIQALDYDEFLNYFCYYDCTNKITNENAFNIKSYQKLSQHLSETSKLFWDSLYLEFSGNEFRKQLFTDDEYSATVLKNINTYLNKQNYNLIKTTINNVQPKYIVGDISELATKAKNKYDFVFLSNILVYLVKLNGADYLNKFKNLLDSLNLNDGGKIFISYDYNADHKFHYLKKEDVLKVFGENNLEHKKFEGMYNFVYNENDNYDAIYIYSKPSSKQKESFDTKNEK